MNSFETDLIKSLKMHLKETKNTIDVNNLLLMYKMKLITEDELKENSVYKKYVDDMFKKNKSFFK